MQERREDDKKDVNIDICSNGYGVCKNANGTISDEPVFTLRDVSLRCQSKRREKNCKRRRRRRGSVSFTFNVYTYIELSVCKI